MNSKQYSSKFESVGEQLSTKIASNSSSLECNKCNSTGISSSDRDIKVSIIQSWC